LKKEFFIQGARKHILTTDKLLHNAVVKLPPQFGTFKQAQKVGKQAELGFG
jgi:hypothetical protein